MISKKLSFPKIIRYLKILWILGLILTCNPTFSQNLNQLEWPIKTVYDKGGLTEGPIVSSDRAVFFSDMDSFEILRYNPVTGKTKVWQDNSGCSNGLFINDGELYTCEATGRVVSRYNIEEGPDPRTIIANSYNGKKFGSPNDLTIINNTLYFSEFWLRSRLEKTNAKREIFTNRVYKVDLENRKVSALNQTFETPNGVASSPQGDYVLFGDIRTNKLFRGEVKHDKI